MFDIEKFKTVETPFFHYDLLLLEKTLTELRNHADRFDFEVHYALKANANDEILNTVRRFDLGADCVSGNEVSKAVEIGFSPDKIVFAGVGKSDKEILQALAHDIFCFNCESSQELEVINSLAESVGKTAKVALRINPNVTADTHKYITTGSDENKFGINVDRLDDVLQALRASSHIKLIGIHFHIGSQITKMDNFKMLCLRINEIQNELEAKGIFPDHLNVGGGLGIDYLNPDGSPIADFKTYFEIFNHHLIRRPQQKIHFELGRAIVGQCGSLISKVLYVKKGSVKQFVILDAGMTELIRPALYQAYHKIQNLTGESRSEQLYDVVGPICESSDSFAKNISLPETYRGDLIAIRSAGAYGEVMTSFYNLRDKAKVLYTTE